MPRSPGQLLRLEIRICVGCAILGAVFLALGGTLGRMAIFLLGWAAGCAMHLLTVAIQGWRTRRRIRG
jgi:uncharacterized membrane protein